MISTRVEQKRAERRACARLSFLFLNKIGSFFVFSIDIFEFYWYNIACLIGNMPHLRGFWPRHQI